MKIAVIGSNGQLGTDLIKKIENCIPLSHEDIDITDIQQCSILKKIKPDIVINTAAYHKTDECEGKPEKSFRINCTGAKNIADICREIECINAFISTDYVFEGSKGGYSEDDIPNPINVYGISKYAGEQITRNYSSRHYIFRVSSLFGSAGASGKGGNFIETMITASKSKDEVTVVDDIFMSPTYTADAAEIIKQVISRGLPFGIYHANNSGCCSWYEFTRQIYTQLSINTKIIPVSSTLYPAKAKRPANSSLINKKIESCHILPRPWQAGLSDYLKEKGHI